MSSRILASLRLHAALVAAPLACFVGGGTAAHAAPADLEAACAAARAQALAKVDGAGVPYFKVDADSDPRVGVDREERLRVGLEMNLADFMRRGLAKDKGDADCARLVAEAKADAATQRSRSVFEAQGLNARLAALSAAQDEAIAALDARQKRLAAFHETRAGVSAAAEEVAALKQDRLDTLSRLDALNRVTAGLVDGAADQAETLVADAKKAAATAARTAADDARGPAWDLTLGAGFSKSRVFNDDLDDRVRYGEGDPFFGSVGLVWRPAVAVSGGATDLAVGASAARLEAQAASWQEDRRSLAETYDAKLHIAEARLAEVASDLAMARESRLAGAQEYAQRLERERRALGVDIADWRARLIALGGKAPVASKPVEAAKPTLAKPTLEAFEALTVTDGSADPVKDRVNAFATRGDKIRAHAAPKGSARGVVAEVTYKGPTDKIDPLQSGAERRQLGVFLAAKDQCNLLYAMWRLPVKGPGPGEIVVQRKVNTGKNTHADCGNGGYETQKPLVTAVPPELKLDDHHALSATLNGARLTVAIDGKTVWDGNVNLAGLEPEKGYVGWRSDNVKTEFALKSGGGAP